MVVAVNWRSRSTPTPHGPSARPLSSFDVVTYAGNGVSGRAIPHNLGTDVGMIIVKWYDGSQNWAVWHRTLTAGKFLILNGTNAENTKQHHFLPRQRQPLQQFYVGSDYASNGTGANYVAYLFAHDPRRPVW
jgi:hypothetical protein